MDPRPDHVDRVVEQWAAERPELDASPIRIVGRVSRLSRGIDRQLKTVFDRHGIEAWEYDVLAALRRSGPPYELTAGALLASLMITSGAVTNRIDRLEARGLVRRVKAPHDGRIVLVQLTAAGRPSSTARRRSTSPTSGRSSGTSPPPRPASSSSCCARFSAGWTTRPAPAPEPRTARSCRRRRARSPSRAAGSRPRARPGRSRPTARRAPAGQLQHRDRADRHAPLRPRDQAVRDHAGRQREQHHENPAARREARDGGSLARGQAISSVVTAAAVDITAM